MHNRRADVIGRYAIFVKTVLLISVEDFTSRLLLVGCFRSRSYCLALDWEMNAGMEIEIFGIGIAVLPKAILHEGSWDCRFTLPLSLAPGPQNTFPCTSYNVLVLIKKEILSGSGMQSRWNNCVIRLSLGRVKPFTSSPTD